MSWVELQWELSESTKLYVLVRMMTWWVILPQQVKQNKEKHKGDVSEEQLVQAHTVPGRGLHSAVKNYRLHNEPQHLNATYI